MQAGVYGYIERIWTAVGVVWLTGTLVSKQTARREPTSSRLLHIAIMAAVFALPFGARLHVGPLAWRFVPDSPVIAWTGLALTAAGCAFAIWARLLLGGNWSFSVTVKQDHRLIRRGPYAIVRHPIYSRFLPGLLGTALALGELRGIAALALAWIGWRMKSRREEAFMTAEFAAEDTPSFCRSHGLELLYSGFGLILWRIRNTQSPISRSRFPNSSLRSAMGPR